LSVLPQDLKQPLINQQPATIGIEREFAAPIRSIYARVGAVLEFPHSCLQVVLSAGRSKGLNAQSLGLVFIEKEQHLLVLWTGKIMGVGRLLQRKRYVMYTTAGPPSPCYFYSPRILLTIAPRPSPWFCSLLFVYLPPPLRPPYVVPNANHRYRHLVVPAATREPKRRAERSVPVRTLPIKMMSTTMIIIHHRQPLRK
jgi:hypothetical protein